MPVPDFSPGEVLTAAAMDSIGLWKVAETTFTASALPFINGCFSSNYENYLVLMNISTSATTNVRFRFRFGTSTTETGSVYDRFGFTQNGATITSGNSAGEGAGYFLSTTSGATEMAPVFFEVFSPNKAVKTVVQPRAWNTASGASHFLVTRMDNTTQYTGIQIAPDSGTLTGAMRVYGYRD
jgi:hypothetical protein